MKIRTTLLLASGLAILAAGMAAQAQPASISKTVPVTGGTSTGTGGTGTTNTGTSAGTGTGGQKPPAGPPPPGPPPPGGPGTGTPPSAPTVVMGTLSAVAANGSTLTVTPAGGKATVFSLTASTALTGTQTITQKQIAMNDLLLVNGTVTVVQVTGIVDNQLPPPVTTAPGTTTTTAPANPPAGSAPGTPPPPGAIQLVGKVVSLMPPAIKLGPDGDGPLVALTLTGSPSPMFTELEALTATELAGLVGDKVTVMGVTSSSGTATALQVNVAAP